MQKKTFYKGEGPAGLRLRPADALGGSRVRGKTFYKGERASVRPRPVDALEGSRFWGKESSSPDPKSGEQWTLLGKVNLLLGDKKIQGARKPSTVLLADICLSVCLCTALHVCVCIPALSLVPFSSGASFFSLSSDLFSFSPSSLICPQLLFFSGVSVNRRTVVGAIDESRPGLHSGGL